MMTNKAFGDAVGCHHSMASRLRAGKRLPSLPMMVRIAEVFDVSLHELVDAKVKGPQAFAELLDRRVFRSSEDVAA